VHWLQNIAIGVAIELCVLALHHWAPGVLSPIENFAFDRMMAIHAVIDPAPPNGHIPPHQIFVNVDDATWRDKGWGGGEPYRAPRASILRLIETAFNHGAQQVVLDILVEGDSDGRLSEQQEDQAFADGLQRLLANKNVGADKQLVLVRSIRRPLPQLALDGNQLTTLPYPALSELRESPRVDEVVANAASPVVLATPYFVYSTDRVLRDWQMLKVVCQRNTEGAAGTVRVIPSVQLLVVMRYIGVSADQMPKQATMPCTPFPREMLAEPAQMLSLAAQQTAIEEQTHTALTSYWKALQSAVLSATDDGPYRGIDVGTAEFDDHTLSNRVIFRSGANLQSNRYFNEIPARALLDGSLDQQGLSKLLSGRVVVIGQSFAEAGDQHYTPMGQMPGSVVLMNAIDSMVRYPLIQRVNTWIGLALSFLLIVVVGYVFARWNSALGPVISTALALPIFAIISFYCFTYGVWLDFVLPLLGILAHREFKAFEERVELRKLAVETDHPH
jgi:CHASE2 domain-containing sensor protein